MPGRRPRHHVDHERPTKGLFISPEASRPPDRRAQSAQSVPRSQFPRPRAPSLALLSMFARWRPGDLTCVGISAPFSDPDPVLLQYITVTRRNTDFASSVKQSHSTGRCVVLTSCYAHLGV